jgi:hypothetical protein
VVLIFLAVVISIFLEPLRLPLRSLTSLAISEAGAAVKYNEQECLRFQSTDRRVELAACILRLADVDAEVRKKGGRDIWRVVATTDKLAAGREELRKALAEIVKVARKNRWIDADKAELWLEKLEEGRVLRGAGRGTKWGW